MKQDFIILHRLRFFARHGILPKEIADGQFFEVTVRLELPLAAAGRADDLTLTVDYQAAHEVIRAVMEGPRRGLVEALAEAVAGELLKAFPMLEAVEVEVVKPQPPVGFEMSGLGAHIRRERGKA
jgi:dihydroneopterin aldolase